MGTQAVHSAGLGDTLFQDPLKRCDLSMGLITIICLDPSPHAGLDRTTGGPHHERHIGPAWLADLKRKIEDSCFHAVMINSRRVWRTSFAFFCCVFRIS